MFEISHLDSDLVGPFSAVVQLSLLSSCSHVYFAAVLTKTELMDKILVHSGFRLFLFPSFNSESLGKLSLKSNPFPSL